MKKLIPALALLVVSAILMGTSTFAWFAMNNTVTATGMKVHTQVNNNLLISQTTTATTTVMAESSFKTNDVETTLSALLEPVSTTNGTSFFYVESNNVSGTGDALSDAYIAYDPSDTDDFEDNAGADGAVGYVDYAFGLKASNTSTSAPAYINVTSIDLVYGTTQTNAEHAFRVAIFVEDLTTTQTASSGAPGTLVTILKPTDGAYFTSNSAVNSTSALATVSNLGTAATIATVAANTTHYYKVVVRLWLEGEDNSCTVSTFASLTDEWLLTVKMDLESATTNAVQVLSTSTTAQKINLASDTASANTKAVDGDTYYQLTTNTDYYTNTASFTSASKVYTIVSNQVVEVTNQCTLPA